MYVPIDKVNKYNIIIYNASIYSIYWFSAIIYLGKCTTVVYDNIYFELPTIILYIII